MGAQAHGSGFADVPRQPLLVPHPKENVEVDVEAHVVLKALGHHLVTTCWRAAPPP